MEDVNVSNCLDKELKKQAEKVLSNMGMNMTTDIKIFLRRDVDQGRIPCEIASDIPNNETVDAINEMDDMLHGKKQSKRYSDTKEFFDELES